MTTLSRGQTEWAIEHLLRHSDTDIFPRAFEFQALSHCKDEVLDLFAKQDICQWVTRPLRKCLTPKQQYGFRVATQLDGLDMLLYTGLMLEIGEDLEKARLGTDLGIVFSSRFKPDTDYFVFDRSLGFPEFQARSRELAAIFPYVVLTDIADFYPRIYYHPIENTLQAKLTSKASHSTAILRLIKSWNQNKSYGIPVGNNPSRLIAELTIDDIDRSLLGEGITFTRYVDDFRLYAHSREEAHQSLIRLANLLYEMHGLTLQAQKTKILPSAVFIAEVLDFEDHKVRETLLRSFSAILEQLGVDDPYEHLDYETLPPELQAKVDRLNLDGVLEEEIQKDEPDLATVRLLVNRMRWLKRTEPLNPLLDRMDHLHAVCAEIVRYIAQLEDVLPEKTRHEIGAALLRKLDGSVISQLEYHRMLIMNLFANSAAWGNAASLPRYYIAASDDWLKRAVLLALGKSAHDYWLKGKKTQVEQMPPWERRAFLYAASCLPPDERRHWYNAIWARLDPLERFVVTWAKANPINM